MGSDHRPDDMASHGADHQPDQGSDQQADRESDRWPAQRVGRTVDPDASAAPDQGTDSLVEDGAGQPAVGAAGSAATAMSQAVRDGLAGTGEATDSAGSGGLAVSQATGAGVAVGGLPADDAVIGGGAAGEVAGRDPQVGAETAKQVVAGKAVADGATDGLVAADVMTSNVVDDVADHETADHETADHETADHELTANEPAAKAVTNDEVATNEAASKAVASAIAARRAVDDAEAAANIGDDVAAAEEMGGGVVADKGVEDVAAGGLAAGVGSQAEDGRLVDDQRNNADTAVEDAEGGGVDGSEPVGNHSDRHPNHITTQAVLAEAKDAMHRPDFRRAIVCGVIALAAPGVVLWLKTIRATHLSAQIAWYACIGACALFGVIAVRSAANEVGRMVRPRGGPGVAGVLRLLITLAGYIAVLATVLDMLGVQLGNLLLSGAITGVIVGIAAQQSLGNAFAGLVLLFSRPFAVGDTITVSSGALGGEHRGEVVAITMMFTVLETKDGPLSLPNSGVLAAATSRRTTKTR